MFIKIIHVISFLKKEGPVEALYNLLNGIKLNGEKSIEIELISFGYSTKKYKKKFDDLGFKTNIIDSFIKFKNYVNGQNKKIILHSHCTKSLLYSTLLMNHLTVHSCQIILGIQSISMHGHIKGRFINLLNKILYYYQDGLIFSSNSVKNSLSPNLINKSEVIYNHVSKPIIKSKSQNYVITISRLSPEKNIAELVEFFLDLDTDLKLYIVGDGSEMNNLKKIVNGNESIKLLGFRDDIDELISKSLFYVSASKTEGLPMSILSALSFNKPLLISEIGPHQELINNNGFTYKLGEKKDFKNKFNLIKSNLDYYSKNSSKIFNKKFNKTALTVKYINFIKKI
jgi:glycosyltransferase involved in cell wall biosynthesis